MQKQEKLLLVGGDLATPDVIDYCKTLGVYTIMTNHIPLNENPFKQMADEAWDIPVEELDILEEKCRDENVTAVFAGVNEHNLDKTQLLAKRLKLPFYASDEGWACARDKSRFKEHCMAVGLDVPTQYAVKPPFTPEVLACVNYPVIVKPVDASAQRGVSVCCSEEQLILAYQNALAFSASGNVLVEDYIEGVEIGIAYCFVDQNPILHMLSACYPIELNNRPTLSFLTPSSYHWRDFQEKHGVQMEKLFMRMGCKTGSMNIQAMYKEGRYYLLEMGYRLDGSGSWRSYKQQTGYSPLELHVDIQLGRGDQRWLPTVGQINPPYILSAYHLYCNPGKISRIVGLDDMKDMDGVNISFSRFREGDVVSSTGNMFQTAFLLMILSKDEESTMECVKRINQTIHFYDEEGKDMLAYFEDYTIFR